MMGPQANRVNRLETPLIPLHAAHRASSCSERGGHGQLCLKPRGGRGIDPKTFRKKGLDSITSSDHWTTVCCVLTGKK